MLIVTERLIFHIGLVVEAGSTRVYQTAESCFIPESYTQKRHEVTFSSTRADCGFGL